MLSFKRKKFLINPKFQLSFIVFSIFVSLLGMGIFYSSIKYFFWSFKKIGQDNGIPEGHLFYQFIEDQARKMDSTFMIAGSVVIIIGLIGSIVISHKVAGPIYRLTKHLHDSSPNDEKLEVKFRKGDFFIELQDAFNQFVNKNKN